MTNRFVYFDLGNVLVTFDHQVAVEQLSQLSEKTASRVHEVVFESGLQNLYETGLVNSSEFVERINRGLGSSLPAADVLEAMSAIFQPNDSILNAFGRVREAHIPMGILSNTCEAHWKWILNQQWPMPGAWFDVHILSYQVQSMKPDKTIYEVCERQAGCVGAQIFFTDDREENIAAARERGWATHLFRSTDEMILAFDAWQKS